jgi:hypothetical protein
MTTITKEDVQKIQGELDHEKEKISCQLYVNLSNLLKKIHDQNFDNLHNQITELFDSHVSKQEFNSIPDLLEYVDSFRDVLDFVRPCYARREPDIQINAQIDYILGNM